MAHLAHRPATVRFVALAAVLLAASAADAVTYGVRVRWSPSAGTTVAGYRVSVRAVSGASLPVVDAGLPAPGPDGALAAQVQGLDGRTDYAVTVTAYDGGGAESAPSNAIAIGYAQMASRIDSDGDGLTDAAEDPNLNRIVDAGESSALRTDSDGDGVGDAADQCEDTAAGAAVNAAGCSCAQVTCTPPPGGTYTIWPSTAAPARADLGPEDPVELGVKFRSDVAGYVTGIRFYKHALNTGTHVGNLWTATGTRLATATFTGETASGWQQVRFAQPVPIAPNTVYVASYFCPNGHPSADVNYFTGRGVDNPPLHALASGVSGPNGVYAYGSASRFPTDTWSGANYWVDVAYSPTVTPPALAVTTASLPGGTVGVAYTATLAANGGTPPYTWSIPGGLPSGLALDPSTGAITGTPTTAGTYSLAVQVRAGSATASRTLGLTVAAAASGTYTIWPTATVPGRPDDGPDRAVELGVKFRSDVAGAITGLRFYKHALNTGTHVGNLWTATGTQLATATFTGETASGWQQVRFAQPVPIAANTVYVASYFCPGGHYSADIDYFAGRGVDRPPLHALASGVSGPNGVYAYGSSSRFPTSTWASANYWVDVVFTPTTPLGGGSTVLAVSTGCAVAADCDDGNPCTTDTCSAEGACANAPRPDGATCDATDACTSADTCVAGLCAPDPAEAAAPRRGMRISLDRQPGGFETSARGRFPVPAGLDPAASGMSLVLEDGLSRPLLEVDVSGADLETTRGGWKLREGATVLDALQVRLRRDEARVQLVGPLPGFDLLGSPPGGGGILRWRVTFGAVCAPPVTFTCTDAANGTRRCRR